MILLLVAAGVLWCFVGLGSFAYWWTKDFDLHVSELGTAAIAGGVLGPFAWLMGRMIHGQKREGSQPSWLQMILLERQHDRRREK